MERFDNPDDPLNGLLYRTGKTCVEQGCFQAAGTAWSPYWCQACNAKRMRRITAQLQEGIERYGELAEDAPQRTHAPVLTEWPGEWRKLPPQVDEHPDGGELGWVVRGHPFNRPVLARSNVGVRKLSPPESGYGPFVRVELMADGLHGQQASEHPWFDALEWRGPLVLPGAEPSPENPSSGPCA